MTKAWWSFKLVITKLLAGVQKSWTFLVNSMAIRSAFGHVLFPILVDVPVAQKVWYVFAEHLCERRAAHRIVIRYDSRIT